MRKVIFWFLYFISVVLFCFFITRDNKVVFTDEEKDCFVITSRVMGNWDGVDENGSPTGGVVSEVLGVYLDESGLPSINNFKLFEKVENGKVNHICVPRGGFDYFVVLTFYTVISVVLLICILLNGNLADFIKLCGICVSVVYELYTLSSFYSNNDILISKIQVIFLGFIPQLFMLYSIFLPNDDKYEYDCKALVFSTLSVLLNIGSSVYIFYNYSMFYNPYFALGISLFMYSLAVLIEYKIEKNNLRKLKNFE